MARAATITPERATSAPAQLTATSPKPPPMMVPPRNAPPALAALNAEMLAVEESVGASPASRTILEASPGTAT